MAKVIHNYGFDRGCGDGIIKAMDNNRKTVYYKFRTATISKSFGVLSIMVAVFNLEYE